jgi:hypothetical protein
MEDVVTGRELGDYRYIFKCFPQDKQQIYDEALRMFSVRRAGLIQEVESKALAIQAQLDAEAEDNGEPEGDPWR